LARLLQSFWHHRCKAVREIRLRRNAMFHFDAIERSRITTALFTLVATAAASMLCLAAAVGPATA
jgi:hypothetical protein